MIMRNRFDRIAFSALVTCMFQGAATAQDAPASADAAPPPAAALADVAWLVGAWEGEAEEGVRMYERWEAPVANLMINTYVEIAPNEAGQDEVSWSEFSHLWEDNGTLYFKGFSIYADDEPVIGKTELVKIEPCAVYFESISLRCADPERPGEGLVATYIEELNGERKENVLTYKKADKD